MPVFSTPNISHGGSRSFAAAIDRDLIAGFRAWPLWTMLGWNDIRQRYRRSVLGPIWITLSMAIFITLLGVIYSHIFHIEIRTYLPYLTLGYIVWGFVSQTTNESAQAFHEAERIIRQIRLPYAVFIFRVVWRNFIVFLHTIVIFVPIAIIFDVRPGFVSLLSIPGLALLCINQAWVTLALAIISTRYRDVQQIVATAVQIALFATPIMWPISALGNAVIIAHFNPLYHLIDLVRAPMLGIAPSGLSWLVAIGCVIVGWIFAILLLRRAARRLVFWL
jgi:ABC-2 type transport system permease protein/lipopolysaccharide transport system permease protein